MYSRVSPVCGVLADEARAGGGIKRSSSRPALCPPRPFNPSIFVKNEGETDRYRMTARTEMA